MRCCCCCCRTASASSSPRFAGRFSVKYQTIDNCSVCACTITCSNSIPLGKEEEELYDLPIEAKRRLQIQYFKDKKEGKYKKKLPLS